MVKSEATTYKWSRMERKAGTRISNVDASLNKSLAPDSLVITNNSQVEQLQGNTTGCPDFSARVHALNDRGE